MKVKDLIAKLQKHDQEAEIVYAVNDNENNDRPVREIFTDRNTRRVVLSDK